MRTRTLALLVALALVAAACGGDSGDDPTTTTADAPTTTETQAESSSTTAAETTTTASEDELSALIEAAQEEGAVTHYSSAATAFLEAQGEAFFEEYGIPVEIVRVNSTALLERFAAETESDQHVADMITVTDQALMDEHPEWFLDPSAWDIPELSNYPDWAIQPECVIHNVNVQGITVNSELVPEENYPQTWADMTDPYWTGRILLTDPRSASAYMGWTKIVADYYGSEYLEGVAAQNPDLVESASTGAQQVAAGAYYANFPAHYTNSTALRAEGAPLVFLPMAEAPGGAASCPAIPQDAPHPNAARLFMNWRLSPHGQEVGCSAVENIPVLPDVPGCIEAPEGWALPTVDWASLRDDAVTAPLLEALGISG